MKLTIEQPKLVAALTKADSVVERRNTIPILSNVLLVAQGGVLNVTATDLDIEITTSVEAKIDTQGSATVSSAMLNGIVSKLKKGALVSLEIVGGSLIVKSGNSRFSLSTLPSDDFPKITNGSFTHTSTVDAEKLAAMFSRVSFAMSNEETRYYLNGAYMHNAENGDLVTVSTDGHRLAKMQSDIDVTVEPVIMPRKAIGLLSKLLTGGDVKLSTSESKFNISGDDFSISGKVIDGTYPDYTRVIPKGNKRRAVIDAKEFKEAIGKVSPIADDKSRSIKMSLKDGSCAMFVQSQLGDGFDEIEATYSDEPLDIGFNSKYLIEVAAQAENGNLDMMFGGTSDPVLITPDAYEGLICVIMPVRI